MIHSNNNTTYYINPAYLTFVEDSGYGANLIQVSASSSCYIRVFIPGEIGYDADGNYRRWKITAYNNKFPDNDAFYIYVRLERDGTSALVVYSKTIYNTDGSSADGSASASDTYYYIRIGEVSATDGTSIREISYDTGRLESDQVKNEGTEVSEMWELDKISTPWLIKAKQWLSSFTVKGFITLVGGLIFKKGDEEKVIEDIKRSTDSDESVPPSDESVPTTKYISNILEELDDKYLRKDQDDTTSFHLDIMGGVTTTQTEYKVKRDDGTGIIDEVSKVVSDIKRSTDSNIEVPIADTNVTTSAYLEKRIELLDDHYLSKIKPDETPYHIKLLNGLTTTYVESTDFAEGTEKGGWAVKKDMDEYWKGEADKLVARVLGQVYDLLVQNNAVFKGPLSSSEFISGFVGGKGWAIRLQEYINAAGQTEQRSVAEFDDLIVRGTMRVFEFVVNQMLGENDNRIFTGMMEVDHYDASDQRIYLSTNGGKLYNPFRVDDIIIVQQYGGVPSEDNGYYVSKQYEFLVTEAGIGDMSSDEDRLDWVRFKNFSSPMTGGDPSLIAKGDTLVRIDNMTDNRRKGIVQIMSVGEDTPYIDILHGAKTDPENSVKGRIGNMGGLYSPLFGWLQEFGAYLINLYAVGEFRIAHTGEDVADSIEISRALSRSNFRQTTYDMTEEDNFFTNASMTNNCEGWTLMSGEEEYFTIDDEPEFFNYELTSSYSSFAGIAELYGRDMLRLSYAQISQDNSLIRKPGTHKVFTSTTENEDGSIDKNFEEVVDTLYLSLRAYCEYSGTLEFGFVDADGSFIDNEFYRSVELEESLDAQSFLLEGVWDSVGNFTIRSTGDIYIDLLSLTDKPLDNFKITTETSIEQDAERISLLGKKVNGVEGSVTNLGVELNATEERITAYVDKEVEGVSASIAQLQIKDGEISALVAKSQGSADDAKSLAEAAKTAADNAQSAADAAQSTANTANAQATVNATAITQNTNGISLLAGAFTLKDGAYELTEAAGAVITNKVAELYATKETVDGVTGDVSSINNRLTIAESGISASATKEYVDEETGKINKAVSSLTVNLKGITGRVSGLEGDAATTKEFIEKSEEQFKELSDDISGLSEWKDEVAEAGLTTTMIQQTKDTISTVSGAFELVNGEYKLTSAAGSVITSNLEESINSQFAALDDKYASVTTSVQFDPSTGEVTSSIKLVADQIDMTANEYINIINEGTTTIAAGRVDLSGVVTSTALDKTLEGYATDTELSNAKSDLDKAISDLNITLSGKIDAKASTEDLTSKVNMLCSYLESNQEDIESAVTEGSTLIVGGYLNTDIIKVRKILADDGTIGAYSITSTEISTSNILAEIEAGNPAKQRMSLTVEGIKTATYGHVYSTTQFGLKYGEILDTGYYIPIEVVHGIGDGANMSYGAAMCGLKLDMHRDDIGLYVSGGSTHILSNGVTKLYGLVLNHRYVSSSTTLEVNDDVVVFNNTSDITVTFPDEAPAGKVYYLKNVSSYQVTVSGSLRQSGSRGSITSFELDNASWMVVKCAGRWTAFYCG